MKSFKYFDLNNSGDVDFAEFVKAIEKIGVQSFAEDVCSFHLISVSYHGFNVRISKSCSLSTTSIIVEVLTTRSSVGLYLVVPLVSLGLLIGIYFSS